MQEEDYKRRKNKKILNTLGSVTKGLRGNKKISLIAYESELPRSVIYYIEQATKDPQLTTIWRLAEGLNLKPSEFIKMIEENMPSDWSILDE